MMTVDRSLPLTSDTPPDLLEPDSSSSYSSGDEASDEQLAETIINEIKDGLYQCLVCTSEIDSSSKIWSCHHCYRVYDQDCIKKWALKGSSTETDRSWRCPWCNGAHYSLKFPYTCWCKKKINPEQNELNPFSCGQTCSHNLKSCVHGCSLTCHPGPHINKCLALGPKLTCHCSKEARQLPCVLTPYETGFSCGAKCDDLMPCGVHKHQLPCHEGVCGECQEMVDAQCYCGKHKKNIKCSDQVPQKSIDWVGMFACDDPCDAFLDCGIHKHEAPCHPLTPTSHVCPKSPAVVKTCPCGKKQLGESRSTCLDPIPSCDETCDKLLPCGDRCPWKCHDGPCSPCYRIKEASCVCKKQNFSVPCKFLTDGNVPKCKRKCESLMSCRRHICERICCPDYQEAFKRDRERRKAMRKGVLVSRNEEMDIEPSHVCIKPCDRLLSCGKHTCPQVDHPGNCPPCLESSSDDLVCECGKTVIPAPVRCGTKVTCTYQCHRPKECGHEPEPHTCHEPEVKCPRCTTLLKKPCRCERKIKVNVLCSQPQVSCGRPCQKLLNCGRHYCDDICPSTKICSGNLSKCTKLVKVSCPCNRIVKHFECCNVAEDQKLECDETCEKILRNKKLFEAFQVSPAVGDIDQVIPYSRYVMNTALKQSSWVNSVVRLFDNLIQSSKKTHHFNPMTTPQRQFIHELAESYNYNSYTLDREPYRSVVIEIKEGSKLPHLSISESIKIFKAKKERDLLASRQKQNSPTESDSNEFFNAIAIQKVFFGATLDEIISTVQELYSPVFPEGLVKCINDGTFYFLPSEPINSSQETELKLIELFEPFTQILSKKSLAFECKLIRVDESYRLIATAPQEYISSGIEKEFETEPVDREEGRESTEKQPEINLQEKGENSCFEPEAISHETVSPIELQEEAGQATEGINVP
ncbi:BA75_02045T0 [Komagataella pastoris]|uniref:BA75_02045T0 n=1 Tax=Komagataella pastoris TaxID=4922 RepID=A0A1B2JE86_PICPA|nr:BA75_02045T0 [Komagataella pastoris]